MKGKRQPAWGALYIWCAIGIGLLFGEHFVPVSPGWHKALEVLVVILIFGVTALWITHNATALDAEARDRERTTGVLGSRRSVPLTPIQSYYLDIMEQQRGRDDTAHIYTTHEVARFSERE